MVGLTAPKRCQTGSQIVGAAILYLASTLECSLIAPSDSDCGERRSFDVLSFPFAAEMDVQGWLAGDVDFLSDVLLTVPCFADFSWNYRS